MGTCDKFLEKISLKSKKNFQEKKNILSFFQYLELVQEKPINHLRNAAQYFCSMVDYFGSYTVNSLASKESSRYGLFDAKFDEEETGKIFGQENSVKKIVGFVRNFAISGRVDKLILLHGPNGSAKTSIIQAMSRGLEYYSKKEEGACYRFSWIFPKNESGGAFGFSSDSHTDKESYAFLAPHEVESKILCEQKDHPILLLPLKERKAFFSSLGENNDNFPVVSDFLRQGDLSAKNKKIFNALLMTYQGDLQKVFKHVQVERFYFSRRYRNGISVIEPQMSVDANVFQMSSQSALAFLPKSLGKLDLFCANGPLVDANRGMIEYSDLLKRPLDTWKYLLVACEQGQISLGVLSFFFDTILFATSNELHLSSFKQHPDWPSYKARIELVRVPYLLCFKEESKIYHHRLKTTLLTTHVAPHAIEMAARWAVLTRLNPPKKENYPKEFQDLVLSLKPEEKADLYDKGEAPARFSQKEAREIRSLLPRITAEWKLENSYEGKEGASPREIISILLNASNNKKYDHLSVLAVFEEIENLLQETSSYSFLRRSAVRNFHDSQYLLGSVKLFYKSILEEEVRGALGFYKRESYEEHFRRYVLHVSGWLKNEQFVDLLLKKPIDADNNFMRQIEKILLAHNENAEDFRNQIISQIAAFNLENPEISIDYGKIFVSHIKKIKDTYYQQNHEMVKKIIKDLLQCEAKEHTHLEQKEIERAKALKEGMLKRGYNDSSCRHALMFLAFDLHTKEKKFVQGILNL